MRQDQLDKAIEAASLKGYSNTPDYHDPSKIQEIASDLGLTLKESEASLIWEWHSSNYAAGWLSDADQQNVESALNHFIHTFGIQTARNGDLIWIAEQLDHGVDRELRGGVLTFRFYQRR